MLFLEFLQEGIYWWKDGRKDEARGFFFLAFLALLLLIGSPILTIESLNYLFNLNIPLDFLSWCAVYWIIFVIRTAVPAGRKLPNNQPQQGVWVVQRGQIPTAPRNNEEEE
jgi:hypothetical protein